MSTLKINTLSNVAGTQSTAVENAIQGSAKAWVNFNGTGTVAIRASYNVSSITDNGTGDYTVNFGTAMSDANYATMKSPGVTALGNWDSYPLTSSQTASSVRISQCRNAGLNADLDQVGIAIFR